MKDLIDRQAAIDAMFANMPGLMFNDVLKILRTLPSAQPQITLESAIDYLHSIGWMQEHDRVLTERKTGRWERHITRYGDDINGFVSNEWICSECGRLANVNSWCQYELTDFCPHCGADMKGGNDETD